MAEPETDFILRWVKERSRGRKAIVLYQICGKSGYDCKGKIWLLAYSSCLFHLGALACRPWQTRAWVLPEESAGGLEDRLYSGTSTALEE